MVPLLRPNTGMKPKYCSRCHTPLTAAAVVLKPSRILFMPKDMTLLRHTVSMEGTPME